MVAQAPRCANCHKVQPPEGPKFRACTKCRTLTSEKTYGCTHSSCTSSSVPDMTWYTGFAVAGDNVGSQNWRRCYQRRWDRRHQAVMLTGPFEYDQVYKFTIRSKNSAAPSTYQLAQSAPEVTCLAQAYRPAAVTGVTVQRALDRRIFLSWAAPDANGNSPLTQYLYQVCAVNKVLSAQDYAIILGMPGTGKTTTLVELTKRNPNTR